MKRRAIILAMISMLSISSVFSGCGKNTEGDVDGDVQSVSDNKSQEDYDNINGGSASTNSDSSDDKNILDSKTDSNAEVEEIKITNEDVKQSIGADIAPPVAVSEYASYEIPNEDTAVMNCVMNDLYTTLYVTNNPAKSGVTMLETGISDWNTSNWNYALNDGSISIEQAVSNGSSLYTYSFEYNDMYYCFCMENAIPQDEMGMYLDNVFLTIGAL